MTRLSLLLLTAAAAAPASAQVTVATYARAEQRLPRRADSLVLRDKITPRWIAGSDRFWYRVRTPAGVEFIYVDPDRGVRRPAFDHVRLAAELGRVADTTLAPSALPFESLEWREEGKRVAVVVGVRGKSWRCDLGKYRCDSIAAAKPANPSEAVSPDGRWAVTLERHNLWIRNTATGERRALTTDGVARHEYGGTLEGNTAWVSAQRLGWPQPPVVLWTADSKRLLVQRIDQRRVPETFLLQSVTASGQRPKSWAFAVPMPGDSVGVAAWVIFDAADGRRTDVAAPAVAVPYQASIAFQQAWWADSAGTRAYYLDPIRGGKVFRFREIDGRTGATRTVAEEAGPTMVEPSLAIGQRPNIRVTSDQREVIWFSQRSGFAHLYLLDPASGVVKAPITSGDWVVREIIRVDERARRIWFTAGGREPGRDPYYRHLYAI
ncbi:MAG: DPP IV N-terminal domain-containing protein, partial [Gemmatimonadetes bacterium]|nr:DPP IV N-terminal domain-containing protein [Gemmatimonadota bacterium]